MLSLMWIGGFVCYILGMTNPLMGMLSVMLIVASPFFAASRLRHFRDYAREGLISFRRGYAYTVLTFFYAGLLLAVAFYVYFAFIDKGFLVSRLMEVMNSDEGREALQTYGMVDEMREGMKELASLRPIDFALNMLTVNIMTGFFLGLPIAAVMRREVRS